MGKLWFSNSNSNTAPHMGFFSETEMEIPNFQDVILRNRENLLKRFVQVKDEMGTKRVMSRSNSYDSNLILLNPQNDVGNETIPVVENQQAITGELFDQESSNLTNNLNEETKDRDQSDTEGLRVEKKLKTISRKNL